MIGIGNEEETALIVYENNDDEALINCHENDELEEEARNQLLAMGPLKRPSSQSSDMWKHIKLMDNMDIHRLEKYRKHYCTHYCIYCGHCMSLPSNESRSKKRILYTSTKANTHLLSYPEFSNEEYKAEKLRAKKVKKESIGYDCKNMEQYDLSFASLQDKTSSSSNKGNIAKLLGMLTSADTVLCAQAVFFVHNPSSQALSIFDCKYFRNMLAAMANNTTANGKLPILDRKQLKRYVEEEYVCFKNRISTQLSIQVEESKGNQFCQLLDDGVTLENKSKYQSFGLQFTDRTFKCNHVVAIAFRRCKDNTGEDSSTLTRTVVKEVTGFQTDEIVGSAVQDGAAKSVARLLGLEVETCDMHDTDKIGQNAIGELTRRKDGREVNPFPEGLQLLKKMRDQAK